MARLEVAQSVRIIEHGELGDVVIQRIDGEVAPEGVFLDRAEDVVAQDAATVMYPRVLRVGRTMVRAEGGHLDDIAAEDDMR